MYAYNLQMLTDVEAAGGAGIALAADDLGLNDNTVTGLEVLNILADFFDNGGDLVAHDNGEGHVFVTAMINLLVGCADAQILILNEHLVIIDLRDGKIYIFYLESFRHSCC
jgi:hypothetical protein